MAHGEGEEYIIKKQRRLPSYIVFGSIFTYAACALIIIAFASPSWLTRNRRVFNTLNKIGLWEVCFTGFWDPILSLNNYEEFERDGYLLKVYSDCRWVFNWDLVRIRLRLLPPWFIATQVFSVFALIPVMLAALINICTLCHCCVRSRKTCYGIHTILMFITFFCASITLAIFGGKALENDEWMPGHRWNQFGWSYAFWIIGTICAFFAGCMYAAQWTKERRGVTQPKPAPLHFQPAFSSSQQMEPMTSTESQSYPMTKYPHESVDTDV